MNKLMCLILLAIVSIAIAERRSGPFGPVEDWPPMPYYAPPTPEEVKHAERERASNVVASAAFKAASSNVLAQLGMDYPTNWQGRIKAAVTLENHGKALKKVKDDAAKTNQASQAALDIYRKAESDSKK